MDRKKDDTRLGRAVFTVTLVAVLVFFWFFLNWFGFWLRFHNWFWLYNWFGFWLNNRFGLRFWLRFWWRWWFR